MEPASELRAIEVRRDFRVKEKRESSGAEGVLLIRVVPPKSFGPYQGSEDFFYYREFPGKRN